MENTTAKMKAARSEKMTRSEHKAFKAWFHMQPTNEAAALKLGVARNTLDRLIVLGSGKPETIAKIREVI